MTFLWVCSTCRLGLSRLAGPEEGEKGGYMVDYKLFDGRLSEATRPHYAAFIAVRPGQAVPVLGRWLVGWESMGARSVQRGHKKSCVSIFHQSRLLRWNAAAGVKIGEKMQRIVLTGLVTAGAEQMGSWHRSW